MTRTTPTWRAALLLGATTLLVTLAACAVDDEFITRSGVFPCETSADCSEGGFVCDPSSKTCTLGIVEPPLCTDADTDGYGVGEERSECRFAEEDPDDSRAAVNPGAEEVCDGLDNDVDGFVDEPRPCERILDCPTRPALPGAPWSCVEGLCVVIPPNTVGGCTGVTIACIDGGFDEAPARALGCFD